jgi:hypothetical protein
MLRTTCRALRQQISRVARQGPRMHTILCCIEMDDLERFLWFCPDVLKGYQKPDGRYFTTHHLLLISIDCHSARIMEYLYPHAAHPSEWEILPCLAYPRRNTSRMLTSESALEAFSVAKKWPEMTPVLCRDDVRFKETWNRIVDEGHLGMMYLALTGGELGHEELRSILKRAAKTDSLGALMLLHQCTSLTPEQIINRRFNYLSIHADPIPDSIQLWLASLCYAEGEDPDPEDFCRPLVDLWDQFHGTSSNEWDDGTSSNEWDDDEEEEDDEQEQA